MEKGTSPKPSLTRPKNPTGPVLPSPTTLTRAGPVRFPRAWPVPFARAWLSPLHRARSARSLSARVTPRDAPSPHRHPGPTRQFPSSSSRRTSLPLDQPRRASSSLRRGPAQPLGPLVSASPCPPLLEAVRVRDHAGSCAICAIRKHGNSIPPRSPERLPSFRAEIHDLLL